MARIVGTFAVPHTPHFPLVVQRQGPGAPEIERLYGSVARCLDAVEPDVIVFITSDHYNIFFEESLPIFSIGVAPSARGPSDYPELPSHEVQMDSDLARSIQTHAVASDFDVGMSQEFELDHSVMVPLHFLTPRMQIPVVPVFVSAFVRPIPSARRCHALGRVIREAVERYPEPRRVAVVATGSFSLEIGGPRISADSHTGIPDPRWVERVASLLGQGQVAELVEEATDDQLAQAGNAGGEVLDWITMLGTIDARRPSVLEVQRTHGHAFAAWPIDTRGAGK